MQFHKQKFNRRELVDVLLTEYNKDPRALLESIVAAQSNAEVFEALEYVSRVEDWDLRISEDGEIIHVDANGDPE